MSLPATRSQEAPAIMPKQAFRYNRVANAGFNWVTDVIHLPGGRRIMTCSEDGSLRVWNLDSGKQVGEDWRDGESRVKAIALSPDGKKVVSGSNDAVRLWDIDAGKVIAKWTGHANSVCWNRDGGRMVSGSYDGTTRVWDVESGEDNLTIETGFNVKAVIFSPDTTMIATGGIMEEPYLGIIKIWDANTAKLVANLKGHTDRVSSLAWTTDGKTLISGSWDKSIMTWNTTTWQQIQVLMEHTNYITGIVISANGRILASASIDDTARLWNLEYGQLIGLPLQHAQPLECVSFSTDGKLLATGCWNNNAYTWDVSAILRDVDLDYLLSDPNDGDKPLLDGDATRRPIRQLKDTRRLRPGFFDQSPDPHFSGIRRLPTSSARHEGAAEVNERTLFGHFSSLFRRTYHNSSHTPSQPRPLDCQRNTAKVHRRHGEGIELQEHRRPAVNVPFAQGYRRNASAREVRMKREKERNAKKASAGHSRPPQSSVTQQSGSAAQIPPSSQSHAAVSTSSSTPAVAAIPAITTSTTAFPDLTIRQAGRWTRFWLRFGCISAECTDGHH